MIRLAFIAVCFLIVFLVGYLTIWKYVIAPMIKKEKQEDKKVGGGCCCGGHNEEVKDGCSEKV